MKTEILQPTQNNIELCAAAIRAGELVAFPTETVYGLGANALDFGAVSKIFEAKGRPSDNPLIVHLGDKRDIQKYAELDPRACLIVDAFMPGAITLLLKKKSIIPDIVTAGRQTVGIRIPDAEVAASFLTACKVPVCAPSANTSSRPSPTQAQHVCDDLSGRIGLILDGGKCGVGIESTIVDLSGQTPMILRRGKITREQIEGVIGQKVLLKDDIDEALCPGLKYKHYAPDAKVILVKKSPEMVQNICKIYDTSVGKVVILCYNQNKEKYEGRFAIALGSSPSEFAQNYYSMLRLMDKEGMDIIICEAPEDSEIGQALFNRMKKSAGNDIR